MIPRRHAGEVGDIQPGQRSEGDGLVGLIAESAAGIEGDCHAVSCEGELPAGQGDAAGEPVVGQLTAEEQRFFRPRRGRGRPFRRR